MNIKQIIKEEIVKVLNEQTPEEKDYKRVDDIVRKAAGNEQKELQLAANMAKAITSKEKAFRRATAAEERGYTEQAKIFYQKAADLGSSDARRKLQHLK